MKQKHTYVVGAGITGLSVAYILSKKGNKVTILESSTEEGGLLGSFEIGGEPIEKYYHHFFTHDKELNWLIDELDLKHKVIKQKTSMGILYEDTLFPMNGVIDIIKLNFVPVVQRIKFLIFSFYMAYLCKWKKYEDTSALNWLSKYKGKQITNLIWEPLFNSKFGTYANEIPLSWLIGRLRQRAKSRSGSDEKLCYFDGGFKVLIDEIIKKLKDQNVEIVYNSKIKETNIKDGKIVSLLINEKSVNVNDSDVVFTTPHTILNQLVKSNKIKNNIEYFGVACCVLELKESLTDHYWINITNKKIPFGGVIEHTNFISKEKYSDTHIIYLSRYHTQDDEIARMNDNDVIQSFIKQLTILNPDFKEEYILKSHLFRSKYAAPVCGKMFSEKILNYKVEDNLYIANMTHVYPDERSTNNSIRIALDCVKTMGINFEPIKNSNSLAGKAIY